MSNWPGLLPALLLSTICQGAFASPAWIEQAAKPGPRIPPLGQSRFDQQFLQASGEYRIPYPFEKLIEVLESRLDNDDKPAVRQVFVPMGRSLQRDTPAPDYFLFPRKVIAIEGEPLTVGRQPGQVMEYRLFIAHQPKTETLEVISYNDAAGRFEFQVVENYAANARPLVRSANRVMCMSCHHNAAPIFARVPWSETSFNVEVASKLVAALPRQFNSLIGVVTLDAGVIDVLAERANYLSAAQAIWKQGCTSIACRAAMLRAALQYRLSGNSGFDSAVSSYQHSYYQSLRANWARQWPQGLALPGSRLSDRNPFASEKVTIEHDPLLPRPAQATWHRPDAVLASGIIYRLAGYFTAADIQRIDQRLIASAKSKSLTTRYLADCAAKPGGTSSYILSCGDSATAGSLQAELEFELFQDRIAFLRFNSLRIPHDINLLQPEIIDLTHNPGRLEARLANDRARLSFRLVNGDRIDAMTLTWDESLSESPSRLEVAVIPEFEVIDSALANLQDKHQTGQAYSLRREVFRRKLVLRELMQELSMDSLEWQETVRRESTQTSIKATGLAGDLALLEPYCAHCHGEETLNPPGFLAGDAPATRVLRCAPRILRRLLAWQNNSHFQRSPMPPPDSIEFSGVTATDWPQSDHYRSLTASLEDLVVSYEGKQRLQSWQQTDYDRLPVCLTATSE